MPSAKPEIVPALSQEELDDLDSEAKRLEAWHLHITGHSLSAIGRMFDVGPTTIGRWIDKVGVERRSRAENIELETERIIALLETAAMDSYKAFGQVMSFNEQSMAAPSHMKNVMEAAIQIARLRGIAPTVRESAGVKATEVVVRIGGTRDSPPIDVTAREITQ